MLFTSFMHLFEHYSHSYIIQCDGFYFRSWVYTKYIYHSYSQLSPVPYGLVVRIPGFHPGGPGSIPGVGTFLKKIFITLHLKLS